MDYTGTGNTLNVRQPAHAAADHGLAALLGHRDARRRVPLRPRLDAGPRVLRRRPAVRLLRPGPAGPGDLPGQADRRAVGRRPRRLPGRQLPAPVDRVERQVPRHRPRLLARRARARWASSPPGSPARPTSTRTTGAGRSPRSTSSPRTTGSPCATWSPTTRSTTRPTARTTGTAPTTTAPGTAASRAPPTTRRCARCARGSGATSSPRCCCPRACRCCSTATSSGAPSAATTTPTARTTRSPGWTGREVRRRPAGLHRRLSALRAGAPGVPAPAVLQRPLRRAGAATGCRDIAWFTADGEEMTDEDWGRRVGRSVACSSTATASPSPTRAASASSTTRSCCCSTPTTTTST